MKFKDFFIWFFALWAIAILSSKVWASDIFALDLVDINYKSYYPGGIDPMINDNGTPGQHLDKGLNLNLNTSIFHYIYWENVVHTKTESNAEDHGQFRTLGWQFELGLKLADSFKIGYFHHSQHVLDVPYVNGAHFPVEDALSLHFILYSKEKDGLFHF